MATVRSPEDGVAPTGAAPTLGLVLAGVALAAAFLPWTGARPLLALAAVDGSAVAAGLASVVTATFACRRYGLLDRSIGSAVAGLFSLGVVVVAVYRLVRPAIGGGTPDIGSGLPVAAVAALGCVAVAVADWLALSDDALWGRVRGFGAAVVMGFLGLVAGGLLGSVVGSIGSAFGRNVEISLLTAGSGVGLVVFTVGYLRLRDLDWSYLDLHWPTRRDAVYTVGGIVLLLVALGGIGYVLQQLGVPSATSSIERQAERMANPVFLLALIPLSFVAIGLGEELVFRNVVQKYLYESFSERGAVVVASVAFAAVHFQQYASPNPVATLTTLGVVFSLSLALGWVYYRTENLVVPILVHGAFNAIQFAGLYVRMTGGLSGLGF